MASADALDSGRLRRWAVVWFAIAAVVSLADQPGAPASGTSALAAEAHTKTPWGDPDLQGVWTGGPMIDVPFERAPGLGTRATLDDQEFARRVQEKERERASDQTEFATHEKGGFVGSPSHWLERGALSRQASLIVDPPDGRLPPLTPDGARRAKAWRDTADSPAGPEDLNAYDRCLTRGVLGSMFPNIYNSAAQIFQTPAYVVIHHEMIHETRIIPLDGRPHLGQGIRPWLGDSRGRWEGNTLVVETTNFDPRTEYEGSGGNRVVVEKFTPVDANTMRYDFTVTDPTTWTQPWSATMPWRRMNEYVYEYACHEGNYAMVHMLQGARAQEKKAAQPRSARKATR